MIIRVHPDWRIVSDPYQWIVQRRRKATARERWDSLAYHRSLDRAVLGLAERRVRFLGGEYGPDALPLLCRTLAAWKAEILSAIERAGIDADPAKAHGRESKGRQS